MYQDDSADVTSDFDIQNSLLLSFLKAEVNCHEINEQLISYWLQ